MTIKGKQPIHLPISEIANKPVKTITAQDYARAHLINAITKMGYSAKTFEEAWGQLVAIQAEIAADPDNGSKATSAIKFVAEAIGISAKIDAAPNEKNDIFPDLSIEECEKLILWLAEHTDEEISSKGQ